jgi:hypothetical protein
VLWETHRDHFGKDGDTLVVQGSTEDFNPTVDANIIKQAYADDAQFAAAEYGGRFRDGLSAFITRDVLDRCIASKVVERQPSAYFKFHAFCDPSGGSSDSFALAIGHRDENGIVIVDCLRESVPPFSPQQVVEDFCRDLARYRVTSVTGDRYAGEFPRELFRNFGVTYRPCTTSASDLFKELLPRLNNGTISLLDHPRAIGQLGNLERRTLAGGREAIDHPRSGKSDIANAIAGLAFICGSIGSVGEFAVGLYGHGGPITWLDNRRGRVSALSGAGGQNECIPTRKRR